MATQFRAVTLAIGLFASVGLAGAEESIVVSSTTSTEQSGLFGHLLPKFEAATGIKVKVVAVGTGQALDIGRRGDADVVFVHDRPAEEKFVEEGYGVERHDVMYNDFVMVGPKADPAKVKPAKDAVDVMKRVAVANATFISRGDKSGTNSAELRLWKAAEVEPTTLTAYKAIGAGMGPTLNMAATTDAYTLADRGTWISFKNRQSLEILFAGDKRLFNPYGVMLVNPAKFPQVKKEAGMKFINWLTSKEGQAAIASYTIKGQQLFFPDAKP